MSRRTFKILPKDKYNRSMLLPKERRKHKDRKDRGCGTCNECARQGLPFSDPEMGGCLWARGRWGRDRMSRPDNTGVVPWIMDLPCPLGSILLYVRPDYPNAWRRNRVAGIIRGAMAQGRWVFVDMDGERRFYVVP